LVRGSRLNVEEVVLHLAGGGVLRRQVELPLAAMENLREVLGLARRRSTSTIALYRQTRPPNDWT
jgi:hypothetical protein